MSYTRTPFKILYPPVPKFNLTSINTVLLISDLQRLTVDKEGGLARLAQLKGVIAEFNDYFNSIERALKNTSSLIDLCRKYKIKIIQTRIVSKTSDAVDIGRHASIWDETFIYNPNDEVLSFNPKKGDVVIEKVCENPFNCTELDQILRNLKVKYLILCGVRTPGYLNTMAFDAADRGYGVIVVSDACSGGVPGGTTGLTGGLVKVKSTKSVIEMLETFEKNMP